MNVIIDFPIPFKLPIENGTEIISSYEKMADFKLTFNRKQYTYIFKDQIESETQYELTTIKVEYSPNKSQKKETDVNCIFHYAVVNSLCYINRFLDAFRNTFESRDIHNITITDLPTTIPIEYDGEYYEYVTYPLEEVREEYEVDKEGVCKVLKILSTWDAYPEIETVGRFFDLARYHLAKEQFAYAIIELQTSFEVFIRNYISDCLSKEGYLNEYGKVDLKAFTKNTRSELDYDSITKRLREKGLIAKDAAIIKR